MQIIFRFFAEMRRNGSKCQKACFNTQRKRSAMYDFHPYTGSKYAFGTFGWCPTGPQTSGFFNLQRKVESSRCESSDCARCRNPHSAFSQNEEETVATYNNKSSTTRVLFPKSVSRQADHNTKANILRFGNSIFPVNIFQSPVGCFRG